MPIVSSVAEAAELLSAADSAGRRVCIGSELDPTGLTRVLEHEPGDLTCVVEAGVRLSTLAETLAPHGQRLALDPPGDPTIGSCIARNLSGPLRHRFGPPRDHLIGATLVLGDGTIVNSGGKVVKNVAGYDLARLMCGSRGSLALIAQVALRLHPAPEATGSLLVETLEPARIVARLAGSQLQPSAVDILHPGRVLVLFEGRGAAVQEQLASAESLLGGSPAGGEAWRESRERQGSAEGRVRFVPGELAATLASLEEAVVRPAAGIAYVPFATPDGRTAGEHALATALKAQLDPRGTLAC